MVDLRTGTLPLLLSIIAVFLIGSCATTGPASNQRAAKRSLANVEAGMNAYHDQHGRWPSSTGALKNFAAQRGRSLDMRPFTKFTITPVNARTVLVRFTTVPPESESVTFATTRTPVK